MIWPENQYFLAKNRRTSNPGNLRAVCSICNEGAANLTLDRPSATKLLAQIRRATADDQLEILRWLARKFPKQTKDLC